MYFRETYRYNPTNAFPEGTHISGKTYITVTDKKCNFSDMCSREHVSLGI